MHRLTPAILIFLLSLLTPAISNSPESNSETQRILREADELFAAQKFTEALRKFEQAQKMFEQQKDTKGMADTFYKIGVCHNTLANYPEAFQALKQAERIHAESGDKQALGFDVTEKANTELLRANFNESLSLSERALKIHQEAGNRKGEADTLRHIGLAHISRGNFPQAAEYTRRSLAIAEEIQDKQGIAMSLKDEGMIHFRQGELQKAQECFEKSWKITEEIHDKRIQARVLSGFALVSGEQGNLKRELEYYQKSGKIAEEIGDRFQQCVVFLNCGSVYFHTNDFRKAYDSLKKASVLAEEIGNNRFLSGGLLGLAMVQFESGTNDTGMDYLRRALALAEKVGDKHTLTYALNELGWYSMEAGDYLPALKYYQRALRLREEMNDKAGIAFSHNYLGAAYEKRGELDLALQSFRNSLSISESLGLKQSMSESYRGVASILYARKEMIEAEKAASQAIEVARISDNRGALSDALHIRSLIFRDGGQMKEALQSFHEAVDAIESVRSDFELPEEKAGYLEARLGVYEDLIDSMLKEKKIPEAFEYAQKSKARAFLDMLTEMRIDPVRNLEPELREKKEKLINEMVDIQGQISEESENETSDRTKLEQLEKKRNELEEQYSNLIVEIRNRNPQLAEVKYPQATGLIQAQELLNEQTILLEYFVGKSMSVLFAITHDSATVYDLPGEKKLSSLVTQIRDVLQKPDPAFEISEQSHSKFLKVSAELYADVMLPAQSHIQGKQRIVIAPDGPLHYLPFECLLTKRIRTASVDFKTLPYLAGEYQIHYVPSVSVFALLSEKQVPEKRTEQKDLLAFADPALYGAQKGTALVRDWVGTLSTLPYTRAEVEGIAHLYAPGKTSVFTGSQASEKNLKKMNLEQYRHLHFASHGLIDEEKPQFSALVLSPDVKEEEDGFLTVREVFDLKLNADLVVLSACKTGLGKRIRGEGVSGLSRAFLYAGTPSVLVSLWNVYDRSTSDLMTTFYRNMEQLKMNKAAALKEARLQMIRSAKYSHPYYWAPFVLIGSN